MSIFNHVALGANDLNLSSRFYDAALGALGVKNLGPFGESVLYGKDAPELMITRPRNGEPACHANGGTVGFVAQTREAVQKFHAAALANGGTCEGEPGLRPFAPTAYGAYARDPAGNKICAFCFAPA
jgi:catechol 2,3-dioxygenase-like lactoylglutathione lyase family enzyme